jgi:hypothetical protein
MERNIIKLADIVREIGGSTVAPLPYKWRDPLPKKVIVPIPGTDQTMLDSLEHVFQWEIPAEKQVDREDEGDPGKIPMKGALIVQETVRDVPEGEVKTMLNKSKFPIALIGYELAFGVDDDKTFTRFDNNLVGGNSIYKTLATVIEASKEFYKKFKDEIAYIMIRPESVMKGGVDDEGAGRMRLYNAYIQRHPFVRANFTVKTVGSKVVLHNRNIPAEYSDLVS